MNNPPLILADEPTGSLDTATAQEIKEPLEQLHREGQIILMVAHNSENRAFFDCTLMLRDGRVESSDCRLPALAAVS